MIYHSEVPSEQDIRDLLDAGRFAEAEKACLSALAENPKSAGLNNLHGDILQAQGRFKDSITPYGLAIKADPNYFPAWYSAGCALNSLTEYAGALPCLEKAVALRPDHLESHHNLAKALYQLGDVDEAIKHFGMALNLEENFPSRTAVATAIPGSPQATHEDVLDARLAWASKYLPVPTRKPHVPHGKPRIGYISSFFESQNWMKPVWGVINNHNRGEFEIYLFSDAPQSECAGYKPHASDFFLEITKLSNEEAAAKIEECELDILVDLNSYSRVERLPVIASKPAPIVIAWFNLYAASGIEAYDYLIGDQYVVKRQEEIYYTETILRTSSSYLTFEVQYPVPDVAPPPCLASGFVTFGCFASLYKLTPQVIGAWAEILRRAPQSRLFLKNGLLHRPSNVHYLKEAFTAHNIDLARLTFEGRSPHFEYLGAYANIDIALDPFPYNGGTTTSEALWQGVPVLCFDGGRWAGRQGVSLLRSAKLDQFVSANLEGCIENAVILATHPATPAKLKVLRQNMRAHLRQSPVCDTKSFTREMESLYRMILQEVK